MAEELDILRIIADNPEISQRKIAEQTGISLGQVNFLIKKCVKKGLVKLEGQTKKSIQYNITPKGLAEKTALSVEYIKVSYNAVIKLTEKIKSTVVGLDKDGQTLIVFGSRDEMMDIIRLAVGNKVSFISQDSPDTVFDDKTIYLCWEEDVIDFLKTRGIKAVNILE